MHLCPQYNLVWFWFYKWADSLIPRFFYIYFFCKPDTSICENMIGILFREYKNSNELRPSPIQAGGTIILPQFPDCSWTTTQPGPKLFLLLIFCLKTYVNRKFLLQNQANLNNIKKKKKKKILERRRQRERVTFTQHNSNGSEVHRGLSALPALQSRLLKEWLRYLHHFPLTTQGLISH